MTKTELNKAVNKAVNKAYSNIRVRKDILQDIDNLAKLHNLDRQDALRMLLENYDNLRVK